MIPRLYAAGTTTFDNEGLGALSDSISCEVSNSINGVPELNLTYPTTGVRANEIGERCVIVADENHNLKGQAFVVRTIDKSTPGTMRIYAIQLAVYYVESTGLEPFTASRLADAIRDMPDHMTNSIPVRVTATLGSSKAFNHSVPSSVKMAMGGMEGSLLDTYGGEWNFYRIDAVLVSRKGDDYGVVIRWGKNLQKLDTTIDWTGTYTGIYPYWVSFEDKHVVQMTNPVYSLGTFDHTRILMMDLSTEFQEEPTEAQLLAYVTAYATRNNLVNPKISWNVELKELRGTPEYEDVALLENVSLGDTVHIFLKPFNVNASARIVSAKYDVLREQYNDLTIGSVRASLASTMAAQAEETEKAAVAGAEGVMGDAIKNATDLITGNKGGYIVTVLNAAGEPIEQLIMDDPDITQASQVWRWNLSGLGYSSTGYQGPYTTAITQNGEIVADFIKTGTLDAAQINVINLIAQHVRATDGNKVMDIASASLKVNNGADWRAWLFTDANNQGALMLYGGTRPNLNGNAADSGNDSTSRMSWIDANGLSVGVNKDNKPTGSINAGYANYYGGVYVHNDSVFVYNSANKLVHWINTSGNHLLYDSNGTTRVSVAGQNGTVQAFDSAGQGRIYLDGASGNVQTYDSTGQERASLYPAEGQLSLYNSSGNRTVQIRGDGTASGNPLPVNQGGTGSTGTESITASVSSTVGSITVTDCRRWGRVAMVTLDCVNTSAITAMNYLARGKLSGTDVPLPKRITTAVQFAGAHLSVCSLDTDGTITSRVMVGTLPASSARRFTFTYLIW